MKFFNEDGLFIGEAKILEYNINEFKEPCCFIKPTGGAGDKKFVDDALIRVQEALDNYNNKK